MSTTVSALYQLIARVTHPHKPSLRWTANTGNAHNKLGEKQLKATSRLTGTRRGNDSAALVFCFQQMNNALPHGQQWTFEER
jgi:hypothetical protein